jgi:hypothetical protein
MPEEIALVEVVETATAAGMTWQDWTELALSVIGLAAVVARFTPNTTDNLIVGWLYSAINQLGMNGSPNSRNL